MPSQATSPFPPDVIGNVRHSSGVSEEIVQAMEQFNDFVRKGSGWGPGSQSRRLRRYTQAVGAAVKALTESAGLRMTESGTFYFDSGGKGALDNLAVDRAVTALLRIPGVTDGVGLVARKHSDAVAARLDQMHEQVERALSAAVRPGMFTADSEHPMIAATLGSDPNPDVVARLEAEVLGASDVLRASLERVFMGELQQGADALWLNRLNRPSPELMAALADVTSPVVPPTQLSQTLANNSLT